MTYIPDSTKWYLAEVVLEFKVETEKQSRIWVNTYLLRADSPEEAYLKAEKRGQDAQDSYINANNSLVMCTFRGLAELQALYEPLEDGAELTYREYDDLSSEEIAELVLSKEQLDVFAPIESETNPNYLPWEWKEQTS